MERSSIQSSAGSRQPASLHEQSAVVIGGGLGGLFTGAILSKEGYRVTVLEKNQVIGGGLQMFRRHGVAFETGMHLLGGIRPGGSIYKLCKWLGITGHIALRDVDADCMDEITYLADGKTYRIPEGKEAFIRYFQQEFPNEAQGIRDYVEELYRITGEIDFFYLRTGNSHVYTHDEKFYWPADRIVDYYLKDPKLRDVISYMNPMFGGVAGHTPGYISALINVLYIEGPSRFVGGSQQLADALAHIICAGGGEVKAGCEVVEMEVTDREVRSVTYRHGGRRLQLPTLGDDGQAVPVVCAIHPLQLLRLTDTKAFSKAYRSRMEEVPQSYSTFCVYCLLKPESFPYINHTCYYQRDYGKVWHYGEYDPADWPRGFMYMTPAETGQGEWATKVVINSPIPYSTCSQWADTTTGRRGSDYEAWKQQHIDRIIDCMELLYPGFRSKCEYIFAAGPLTIRDYYGQPEGSLYGLLRDCDNLARSQVPVFTKLHNLYMTGQNVNLHGFCGVPLTAINTVEAIVGLNQIIKKINETE